MLSSHVYCDNIVEMTGVAPRGTARVGVVVVGKVAARHELEGRDLLPWGAGVCHWLTDADTCRTAPFSVSEAYRGELVEVVDHPDEPGAAA